MSELIKLQNEINSLMDIKEDIRAKEQAYKNLGDVCFLLDFSSSMSETVENDTKENHLRKMLKQLGVKEQNCISFHSIVQKGIMDETAGTTRLDLALTEFVKSDFKKAIIISDGEADVPQYCFNAVKGTTKKISSIFIGNNPAAKKLLDDLTKQTGGESLLITSNIAKMLKEKVTLLLTN